MVSEENEYSKEKKDYILDMSLALENFTKLAVDKDVNDSFGNKKNLVAPANNHGNEDGDDDHEIEM